MEEAITVTEAMMAIYLPFPGNTVADSFRRYQTMTIRNGNTKYQ